MPPQANAHAANTPRNAANATNEADTRWVALRRRHSEEIYKFREHVTARRAKLEEDVQRGKLALLAKHKREEEEFWKRSIGNFMEDNAGTKSNTAGRKVAATKKPAKEKDAKAVKEKTGGVDRKTADTPSTQKTVTDRRSPAAYINLVSDSEEDEEDKLVEILNPKTLSVPQSTNNTKKPTASAPSAKPITQSTNAETPVTKREEPTRSIPSATIELFGDKPKTFGEIVPSEREMRTFTLEATPFRQVNSSATTSKEQSFKIPPGTKTTFGASAASSAFNGSLGNSMFGSSFPGSQVFPALGSNGTASRPGPLSGFTWNTPKMPENQNSGSRRHAPGLFTQPSPAALPQQNPFEQRSQSTVPEKPSFGGLPLEHSHVNVPYQASVSTEEEEESLFIPERSSMGREDDVEVIGEDIVMLGAQQTSGKVVKPQQHAPNMIPSPCPTEPSMPSTPNFRKPMLPASATEDAISAFKNVRASSQTSASTMPAIGPTGSHRTTSVASPLSSSQRTITTRKRNRRVVNLSSDEEESDYASEPSEDEEDLYAPSEAEQESKAVRAKVQKVQPGRVYKKAKTETKKGKNSFGFHVLTQSKSDVRNTQLVPPSPKSPPKATPRKPLPPSPRKPISSYKKPAKSPRLTSHRPSKLAAATKISQQFALDIETASQASPAREEPESGDVEDVRGGLRSMSLTPASSDVTAEDVAALSETGVTGTGCGGKALRSGTKGPKGWPTWVKQRQTGDRYLHSIGQGGEEWGYEREEEVEGYDIKSDELWKARKLREE